MTTGCARSDSCILSECIGRTFRNVISIAAEIYNWTETSNSRGSSEAVGIYSPESDIVHGDEVECWQKRVAMKMHSLQVKCVQDNSY